MWDPDEATAVVREGYERVAERYRRWTALHDATRAWFLDEVAVRVPDGSLVVELGCGAGEPVGAALARRTRYLGVDLSERQIRLARAAAPEARLVVADLARLELQAASVDAVVACYVMGHVPLGVRAEVWSRIGAWLRPGGWFCGSLTAGDQLGEGVEEDWLGAPMFFASLTWSEERALMDGAGLDVEAERVVIDDEDGEPASFRWVFAHRRGVVARPADPA